MAAAAPVRQRSSNVVFPRTNPLPGINGVAVFVALGIGGVIVDLLTCWSYLNLGDASKNLIAKLFVVLLVAGWISFSLAEDLASFIARSVLILLLSSPIVAMILTQVGAFFWSTLLMMTVMAVSTVLLEIENENPWTKVIAGLYAAWVVAGVIVTLGSPRLLGYAASAASLSEFHFLLDARYLITALLLLTAFGEAMFIAFEAGLPKLPPSPKLRSLDEALLPESAVGILLRPIFVFTNLFIMILQALITLVWQLVGFIVTYLYRTAKNLAHKIHSLITDRHIIKAVGKVVTTFVTALLYVLMLSGIAADLTLYLTSSTSPFSLSGALIVVMARLLFFAIATTGCVLLLARLWKTQGGVMDQAAFGGSMILVSLALSAALMYAIAKTHMLAIVGFDSIGILTLLLVILLGSVFAYHVALLVTGKARQAT